MNSSVDISKDPNPADYKSALARVVEILVGKG
jgi:hypothetical protein